MNDQITTTYRDKTLTYHEGENDWRCEDFSNATRGSPSLTLAKARVDKMLDGEGEKPKPFEKFQVWSPRHGYDSGWVKVTITGKAERGELWASHDRKRSKYSAYDIQRCKQDTPGNDAIIQKIKDLEAQIDSLHDQIYAEEKTLTPYKP